MAEQLNRIIARLYSQRNGRSVSGCCLGRGVDREFAAGVDEISDGDRSVFSVGHNTIRKGDEEHPELKNKQVVNVLS